MVTEAVVVTARLAWALTSATTKLWDAASSTSTNRAMANPSNDTATTRVMANPHNDTAPTKANSKASQSAGATAYRIPTPSNKIWISVIVFPVDMTSIIKDFNAPIRA
jgi:hypothetical protein